MKIIIDNLADDAVITATPPLVTKLPPSNLQTEFREEVARTTGLADQTIALTWAKAQLISGVVLYRGNFSSFATWRVRLYDTPAMGSLLYDSDVKYIAPPKPLGELRFGIDPLGVSVFSGWGYTFSELWFTHQTGAYMTITLSDPDNPDGYMQASRLFVAYEFDTKSIPQQGADFTWADTSKQTRTEGGTLRTEAGASYRAVRVSGVITTETERSIIADLQRKCGLRKDIYVSLTPEMYNSFARDHAMQCKLVSMDAITIPGSFRFRANVTLNLQEA